MTKTIFLHCQGVKKGMFLKVGIWMKHAKFHMNLQQCLLAVSECMPNGVRFNIGYSFTPMFRREKLWTGVLLNRQWISVSVTVVLSVYRLVVTEKATSSLDGILIRNLPQAHHLRMIIIWMRQLNLSCQNMTKLYRKTILREWTSTETALFPMAIRTVHGLQKNWIYTQNGGKCWMVRTESVLSTMREIMEIRIVFPMIIHCTVIQLPQQHRELLNL